MPSFATSGWGGFKISFYSLEIYHMENLLLVCNHAKEHPLLGAKLDSLKLFQAAVGLAITNRSAFVSSIEINSLCHAV
jgi:hypothetical protein